MERSAVVLHWLIALRDIFILATGFNRYRLIFRRFSSEKNHLLCHAANNIAVNRLSSYVNFTRFIDE